MDFTVIIPTYNGADRLPKVLDCLKQQKQLEALTIEIIVVDNNSTNHTAKVVKNYQENPSFSIPLKYCFETQQGIGYARQRGVREAQGELIVFIDDDNLITENWLYEAYLFAQNYPKAGAYGGKILGQYEEDPPENFEKIAQFLAIRDQGDQPFLFDPENLRLPPGAGLVIRKKAWDQSIVSQVNLVGKTHKNRISGSDYWLLLHLYQQGWEIWYNPQMIMYHFIPSQRLTKEYLLPLAKGIGLVTCQLRMILAKDWQKPLIFVRTLLGNLKRIILHLIKYKLRVKQDLIAAFELQFYWGSFLSPFYYLQQLFTLKKS
jgi:glycosyltransferase involved in cell wall biosynthesis